MKTFYLLVAFLFSSSLLFGQDTLFMNNEKVLANVKEITQDAVKVQYKKEKSLSALDKSSIQKIIFKDGHTQSFTEASSFKKVNSVEDFENVTITSFEGEIKGLSKIGDVSAKAQGVTPFSKEGKVRTKTYRTLKVKGALMGANLVYLSHQKIERKSIGAGYIPMAGRAGGGYTPMAGGGIYTGSSTETSLSGIAYSSMPLDYNKFNSLINNKALFTTNTRYILLSRKDEAVKERYKRKFSIINIKNENGITIIEAQLQGERKHKFFNLTYFDEEGFNIFYQNKNAINNIRISYN